MQKASQAEAHLVVLYAIVVPQLLQNTALALGCKCQSLLSSSMHAA
jgi:hypothetical protein